MRVLKIFIISVVSILSFSCDGVDTPVDGGTGSGNNTVPGVDAPSVLTLDANTFYIKADGADKSTFVVSLDGVVLTEGYTISQIVDGQLQDYTADGWVSSVEAEARFVAFYEKDEERLESSAITVKAVNYDVPVTVADPKPSSYDFVRRLFMVQFTGTECVNCPKMKQELESFLSKEANSSRVVLASAHCGIYTETDPARIDIPLDGALGANVKPSLVLDFNTTASYRVEWGDNFPSQLTQKFERLYQLSPALAGISVNSVIDGEKLRAKVSVKVAESSKFRVGAWILEDGIEGIQTGAPDQSYNIHNNCVRAVQGEVAANEDYSGFSLGQLSKGDRVEYMFEFDIEQKWVLENCRLVVFITTPNTRGDKYFVNNVIDCGTLTGQTAYDYK